MLSCKSVESYLTVGWDKEVTGKEIKDLKRHLETCARCSELSIDLEATWKFLDNWREIEPSRNFKESFWNKVEFLEKKSLYSPWKIDPFTLSWRVLGVAVAVFLVLCIGIYFSYHNNPAIVEYVNNTQVDKIDDQFLKDLYKTLYNDPEYLSIYAEWGPDDSNGLTDLAKEK